MDIKQTHSTFMKRINEANKITNLNIEDYQILIYAAYVASPTSDMTPYYDALKQSNMKLFKRMISKLDVNFTDDYDNIGYKSANDMIARLDKEGVIHVDTRYSDSHDYFTPEENVIFRAVHDYYTHILRGKKFNQSYNFDLKGELQTYNTHSKLAPTQAIPALFSEVVCQVCFEVTTGAFPDPQKSAFIKGADFKNVGVISFKNNPANLSLGSGHYEDNFSDIETQLAQIGHGALEIYKRMSGAGDVTEDMEDSISSGRVKLYHYTNSTNLADGGILEPGCSPNSWSRREYQVCKTPRVFFYTSPDPERLLKNTSISLTTEVDESDICDLYSNAVPKNEGETIDEWLGNIRSEGYKGAKYSVGSREVVVWFEPIRVEPLEKDLSENSDGNEWKSIEKGTKVKISKTVFSVVSSHGIVKNAVKLGSKGLKMYQLKPITRGSKTIGVFYNDSEDPIMTSEYEII